MIGLRHDIDSHPFKALELAKIEYELGIRSTFFDLHSADYYGTYNNTQVHRYQKIFKLFQNINRMGHEIGVHNDLITLMLDHQIEPVMFQKSEIEY